MSKIEKIPTSSFSDIQGALTFHAPAAVDQITFTLPHLAGCMARAAANGVSSPAALKGLTQTFRALLDTYVDPGYSAFTFLTDVEHMSDHMRTAFSSVIGAGMADLYMTQLGYVFRCNGKELVKNVTGTGTIFDLAYDASQPGAVALVAVEAKGRIRSSADRALIARDTIAGYRLQVVPHLATTMDAARIVHGYGIGTGSQIKRGGACEIHLEQTRWIPTTTPPATVPVSVPIAGSVNPFAPAGLPVVMRQPHAKLAIANYRDVFRLIGAQGILGVLDAVLRADWKGIMQRSDVLLEQIQWRGETYVAAPRASLADLLGGGPHFGLRLDVARQFLAGVSSIIGVSKIGVLFPREIVTRPSTVTENRLWQDNGAEYPDGLAYFGDIWLWTPGQRLWWNIAGGELSTISAN